MPSVKLNKEVFEKLVGKKLPLEKLKDRISYLGTDLEKIEGNEIHVEVFPNRADMLSEQGFARAFSAFIGQKIGLREYSAKKSGCKLIMEKSLPKKWPYALACIVKGLTFNDEKIREVIQLQEKLGMTLLRKRKKGGLGLYPLEKIEFPILFKGMDPDAIKFRPLEHPEVITGREILTEHSTGREYAHIVENWDRFPVFVDNKGVIMSMPPIINSHNVGKINETTKDVFLEITGNDFNTLQIALNIMVTSLADMGGTIYSIGCVQQNGKTIVVPNLKPREMTLDIDYCNKLLGLDLSKKDVKILLERMGYGVANGKILVPAYRADILHQMDLVEDIAIAYGYDNFTAEIPKISTIGNEDPYYRFRERLANLLIGIRFMEVSTYHLTSLDINKKMQHDIEMIEVENSKSIEYSALRAWLVPNMLKVLSENTDNPYRQEIFEIGGVFRKNEKEETNIEERFKLAVAISHAKANYTDARRVLDLILNHLEMKADLEALEHSSFIQGRAASVKVKGLKVGFLGEIHPKVLQNWNLEMPVAALEIDIDALYELFEKSAR